MRAELCPINYEDEEVIVASKENESDPAQRMVTWKRIVATPFKTP
jgi:hypothetical protein